MLLNLTEYYNIFKPLKYLCYSLVIYKPLELIYLFRYLKIRNLCGVFFFFNCPIFR